MGVKELGKPSELPTVGQRFKSTPLHRAAKPEGGRNSVPDPKTINSRTVTKSFQIRGGYDIRAKSLLQLQF